MPEPSQPADRQADRTDADRAADHAAIDRLSAELLPALIAKLGRDGSRRARGPRGRLAGPAAPAGFAGARPPPAAKERRAGDRDRERDRAGRPQPQRRAAARA